MTVVNNSGPPSAPTYEKEKGRTKREAAKIDRIKQAKQFKAKNVLIKNKKFYLKVKNSLKGIKVYSGDISLQKIVHKKLDYTMSAVVGLAGLQPTIDAIKISSTVAIANNLSLFILNSLLLVIF